MLPDSVNAKVNILGPNYMETLRADLSEEALQWVTRSDSDLVSLMGLTCGLTSCDLASCGLFPLPYPEPPLTPNATPNSTPSPNPNADPIPNPNSNQCRAPHDATAATTSEVTAS